jgi:ribosomal protein S17E
MNEIAGYVMHVVTMAPSIYQTIVGGNESLPQNVVFGYIDRSAERRRISSVGRAHDS